MEFVGDLKRMYEITFVIKAGAVSLN